MVNARAVKSVSNVDKFLGMTMGRKGYYPGEPALAKDFKLPLDGHAVVEAFILTCETGTVGPDASIHLPPPLNTTEFGPWVFLLTHNKMAMKWYDDTILLLQRENNKMPRR